MIGRYVGSTLVGGFGGRIDSSVPHMARVYDYMLGGTNNFAVDRELAEHATAALGPSSSGRRRPSTSPGP